MWRAAAIALALAVWPAAAQAEFGELGAYHTRPGSPPSSANAPRAVAVDRSTGDLYVAWNSNTGNGIDHLRADGTYVRTIPLTGSGPLSFGEAELNKVPEGGLAFDSQRKVLYALQPFRCRVHMWDGPTGADLGDFFVFGLETPDFSCSQAEFEGTGGSLAVNQSNGSLYVSGREHRPSGDPQHPFTNLPTVQVYTRDPVTGRGILSTTRFGRAPNEDKPSDSPAGTLRPPNAAKLALDPRDNGIWVADEGPGATPAGRIQKFTAAGGYVSGSQFLFTKSDRIQVLFGFDVASDGRIALTTDRIADPSNSLITLKSPRVRFYSSTTSRVTGLSREFGSWANPPGPCRFGGLESAEDGPIGHAFRSSGDLYSVMSSQSRGSAYVKHFGEGGSGCNSKPTASFVAPARAEAHTPASFDASASRDPETSVATYEWDFDGDGAYEVQTTQAIAQHTYTTSLGDVNVGLRVIDTDGARSDRFEQRLFVAGRPPVASFTRTPEEPAAGQQVTFDATASDRDAALVRYEWDLDGDGSFETDTGADPVAASAFPAGTRTVRLRVTDNESRQASAEQTFEVFGDAATATFTWSPETPEVAQTVTFDGSASDTPDVEISRYEWDLDGDGTFELDTGPTPTAQRSFATRGEKTVRLRVTDSSDRTSAPATRTLTVVARPPVASFTHAPATPAAGEQVSFDGSASDRDGSIVRYEWDLDGDGLYETDTGGVAAVNRTFSAPGDYTVGLRVTDDATPARTSARFETAVRVVSAPPRASFTVTPDTVEAGGAVTFDGSASSSPEGAIVRYEWDFDGDGTYDAETAGATTDHTYGTVGQFAARLRVTDSAGGVSPRAERTVTVIARPPRASFAISPAEPEVAQEVTFDGSASNRDGSIVRYMWDLDADGTFETDTGSSPVARRTYGSRLTGTVALRVTDDLGRQDTATRSLTVHPRPPLANFSYSPRPPLERQEVTFNASASDRDRSLVRYEWDFDGDGTFEVDGRRSRLAKHTYNSPGDRQVSLRVTDEIGRTDVNSTVVQVQPSLTPAPLPPVGLPFRTVAASSGLPRLASASRVRAVRSALTLPIACPEDEMCAGTVAAYSADFSVRLPSRRRTGASADRRITLGKRDFMLEAGSEKVVLRLRSKARKLLANRRSLYAVITMEPADGGPVEATTMVIRAAGRGRSAR